MTLRRYRRVAVVRPKYGHVQGAGDSIERIKYKSPVPSNPIVDECACDDGGVIDPPDDLPLTLSGVMGQEDTLRDESGTQVENFLVGRIVASTENPAQIRVFYGVEEFDEYETEWTDEYEEDPEIFIPLYHLNALYQFKVEVRNEEGETLLSSIHRFTTAGAALVSNSSQFFSPEFLLIAEASLSLVWTPTSVVVEEGSPNRDGEVEFLAPVLSPKSTSTYSHTITPFTVSVSAS